jgi:hypothetical protein
MCLAGTGVHGRHQHEAGREVHRGRGPGDRDLAGFQGLAQHLQHAFFELGQLVQKQHPVVGQAHLARTWARCPLRSAPRRRRCGGASGRAGADQGLARGRVPATEATWVTSMASSKVSGGRMVARAAGQHGLARARRPHHEHVVSPGRGDGERPLHMLLALYLVEVQGIVNGLGHEGGGVRPGPLYGLAPHEVATTSSKAPASKTVQPLHHRGLRSVLLGNHQSGETVPLGGHGHGQHPAHRTDDPVQGQLAHHRAGPGGIRA